MGQADPVVVSSAAMIQPDSSYAGNHVANDSRIRVEIVRMPKGEVGFALHAQRWLVERSFAWISRNRRLARDCAASIGSARAFLSAASACRCGNGVLVAGEMRDRI